MLAPTTTRRHRIEPQPYPRSASRRPWRRRHMASVWARPRMVKRTPSFRVDPNDSKAPSAQKQGRMFRRVSRRPSEPSRRRSDARFSECPRSGAGAQGAFGTSHRTIHYHAIHPTSRPARRTFPPSGASPEPGATESKAQRHDMGQRARSPAPSATVGFGLLLLQSKQGS